jgi:hypothetical protein
VKISTTTKLINSCTGAAFIAYQPSVCVNPR